LINGSVTFYHVYRLPFYLFRKYFLLVPFTFYLLFERQIVEPVNAVDELNRPVTGTVILS